MAAIRNLILALSILLIVGVTGQAGAMRIAALLGVSTDADRQDNCGGRQHLWRAQLGRSPPSDLQMLICLPAFHTPGLISPDAGAVFVNSWPKGPFVGSLAFGRRLNSPVGENAETLWADDIGRLATKRATAQWNRKSDFLWISRRVVADRRVRNRGVEAVRLRRDGRVETLPPLLRHGRQPEAIHWIGRDGLAFALFDVGNSVGEPPADFDPVVALVDAGRGDILDVIPCQEWVRGDANGQRSGCAIDRISAVRTRAGVVHAVFGRSDGAVRVWRQAAGLSALPMGYPGGNADLDLTPDGERLLVTSNLQPYGGSCPMVPPCDPTYPRTGKIAALYDLNSGRRLWSINGTARGRASYGRTTIRDDGRFALISIPPASYTGWGDVALVAMDTGEIRRVWPVLTGSPHAMGFSAAGGRVWIDSAGMVAFYNVGG